MVSLATPPLFARLRAARTVLIAGAGGGFDVFAGIPLGVALRQQGKNVHYASPSFSDLERLDLDAWLERGLAAVEPETSGEDAYFPERELARFLNDTVYAFPRMGVRPLRRAYRTLVKSTPSTRSCSSTAARTSFCAATNSTSALPRRT
ncbi:hypothetical protein V1227_01065 [Lentzea sp. DG1S-22]|nr:hypothetical protein [Lentzea sp. DG1S-22]WVH81374.1 hypothetical protein V1227_01065 [Lentzea sp. DG1S-22]